MKTKKFDKDLQLVLDGVLPLVPEGRKVERADFEVVHGEILAWVEKNTGASPILLRRLMDKVLREMPNEYGRLDKHLRSWPAMITYLYTKYLLELDADGTTSRQPSATPEQAH